MRGWDRMHCALLLSLLALASCHGAPSRNGGGTGPSSFAPSTARTGGGPTDPVDGAMPLPAEDRGSVPVSTLGGGATRVDRAIRRYAGDHAGRLPASLAGLLKEADPDGAPYLRDAPSDAWGRPLSYAVLSARYGVYELRSFGPDGIPATGDDLVSKPEPVPFD